MKFYLLLSLLVLINSAFGIAVSNLQTAEENPNLIPSFSNFNWDYVYSYNGSSAVAVDPYWIITAAHVADDNDNGYIEVNGEVYNEVQKVYHSPDFDPENSESADLALIRLDKSLPGHYPIYNRNIYPSDDLIFTGWGKTGTVYSSYFMNGPSGQGTKRWGTNKMESTGISPPIDDGGTSGPKITKYFQTDFSINDTTYEAAGVGFDSGGGIFLEYRGQWRLAGILLYLSGSDPNYTGNIAANISDYSDWIELMINNNDSDSDGLPDHYESSYGNGQNMNPNDDLDSDSFTNYDEWIADTNPNNSESFFKILHPYNPSNLTFSSSILREYKILYSTNLKNNSWINTNEWFSGNSVQTTAQIPIIQNSRFNRVEVQIP